MSVVDRSRAGVVTWFATSLLLAVLLLPTPSDAQQVVRLPVPYHSQLPPNDPLKPNWVWAEPGNAPIPNGFCTCACLDMLFNHWAGGAIPHANPPLPQQEFAAVANTNDPMGGGTYSGTYLTDARRAVHFSPTTPAWPSAPPAYVNQNRTGYTWPLAIALPGPRSKYGMIGIEGDWTANGWTMAQFKQVLALGYPIIVNVNAAACSDSMPGLDPEDPDTDFTGYDSVENTASGHSIVVRGYHNPANTFLIHDPTLGPALAINQSTFWNSWWTSKEFLLVAPWSTSVGLPPLGSFSPNGFQTTATATYTDPLPTPGTGASVQTQGKLGFYAISSDELNAALAQRQPRTLNFNQVTSSGQWQQRPWQCVTVGFGNETVAVAETWGRVNASAHSFPGGYTDDIGSLSPRTTVDVPFPEVGDVSICNIPRGRWWDGAHVWVFPHDFAPGVPNDFVVELENRGVLPVTDVFVDFYFGDPCLEELAPDPFMMPFGTTVVPIIHPGETVLTDPVLFVPPTGNSFGQDYYNFVVACHAAEDPPHDEWVELDNNIACKAVHHAEIEPLTGTLLRYYARNPFPEPCRVVTRLETAMPDDWFSQLLPAGAESVMMVPGQIQPRSLTMEAGSEGIGMATVTEDFYDLDNNFLRRTGGLSFTVWTPGTGVSGEDVETARGIELAAPFPNPTTGDAQVAFALPTAGFVELDVFDVAGRRVAELFSGSAAAGRTLVRWDGRDDAGSSVARGVYFVRLRSSGEERVRKLVVLQ